MLSLQYLPSNFAVPAKSSTAPRSATLQQDNTSPLAKSTVSLEYASMGHRWHCPLGIYVVPSADSIMVWDGVFFVHQGYYSDAVFKFQLLFPADYPERAPQVQFVTDIFHPLVSQDGVFSLSPRFRPWRPREHHVFDVLYWIKGAFKKKELDKVQTHDALNKEAFRYHDATQTFANLASQSTQLSQTMAAIFARDVPPTARGANHSMRFRELNVDQLAAARKSLGLKEWNVEDAE